METIDGDFVVISDPMNLSEKEAVENLFKRIIDEKVPNKKFAMSLRKNSESTDEEQKKSSSNFEKNRHEKKIIFKQKLVNIHQKARKNH